MCVPVEYVEHTSSRTSSTKATQALTGYGFRALHSSGLAADSCFGVQAAFAEDLKSRAGSPITAFQMDWALQACRPQVSLPSSPVLGFTTFGYLRSQLRLNRKEVWSVVKSGGSPKPVT